ncbi:ThiF family adenylyltransferase [Bergeyella zoohelcum]|uniref:Thiamine biosynthesis protein ThiF n=1 Tax=Bergeyella zoohelcum TaxID=1015 RepID=A0A7Z8YNT0_9FLAO|nr:ThiF family adenylyltransferase [Bergeyella zoohelcum]VDH04163.1 thiamine biosynthesis protein ThiF [Bergeyella zoohelcum]
MMHNNYFNRQELVIGKEVGEKIKSTKVLVIGAGAGGNEVLKNLALMGFGNFTIVDFDPIEDSNLSRTTLFSKSDIGKSKAEVAANTLQQISLHESPSIKGINAKIQDIGKQIFLENDIVVCCVDTMDARAYINDWCVRLKKPFFEMGFEKFTIQISFFPNEKPTDACFREVIGFVDFTGVRQSCSKLKFIDTKLEHIPTIQVAAAFAGVMIATEVILFLKGESQLKNKVLQYAADCHRILKVDYPQSERCYLHKDVHHQIFESNLTKSNTFKDLLQELKNEFNSDFYINWREEFIYSMECESCGKTLEIKKFKSDVYDNERWCVDCQDKYNENEGVKAKWVINKELLLTNSNHKFFLEIPMSDFGIKDNDIVIVNDLHLNNSKMVLLI